MKTEAGAEALVGTATCKGSLFGGEKAEREELTPETLGCTKLLMASHASLLAEWLFNLVQSSLLSPPEVAVS